MNNAVKKTAVVLVGIFVVLFSIVLVLGGYVASVYNTIKTINVEVDGLYAEVSSQYQRRADLVPQLVGAVKGAAGHENDTLRQVIEARSKATSVQLTADALKDPQAMQAFQQRQGELTQALSKLMMLTENYPQLKANDNFRDLQAQLEGTENRIAVARNRAINGTVAFNKALVTFPSNVIGSFFGIKERPQFAADESTKIAPVIDFSKGKQ